MKAVPPPEHREAPPLAEEWQCRHVFTDKRCCVLPKDHTGNHKPASENEPSEILAWLNLEQKRAERWFRAASGVNRFALSAPELMRIRHSLEIASSPAAHAERPDIESLRALLREVYEWQRGVQELLPDGLDERLRAALSERAPEPPREPLRTHLGWLLAKVMKDANYPEARAIWEQWSDYVDSLGPKQCEDRTGGGRYRCLMVAGHDAPHRNGNTTWPSQEEPQK